jgi:hypothetical protein
MARSENKNQLTSLSEKDLIKLRTRVCRRAIGDLGFAVGQDETHFHVLGGNQSDAVTIARIARTRLLGARWPATVPPRVQPLPTIKPGELLITANEV